MEDPNKSRTLPEVTITAKRIDPKRYKIAKVRLYPKGEANQSTIDSLMKAGRGDLIGEPTREKGKMDMYGEVASDVIKQLTHGR